MLRDVLGVSQDADAFEGAPCTDLSLNLWDPQGEWESLKDARARHEVAAQICRSECHALVACQTRRDRLHAAKRLTAGVWAGQEPGRGGSRPGAGRSGCGTDAGYQAHRKDGEDACDPCAAAHRDYMRAYMADRRRV